MKEKNLSELLNHLEKAKSAKAGDAKLWVYKLPTGTAYDCQAAEDIPLGGLFFAQAW